MRLPVDDKIKLQAQAKGLPMFRVQIDWRFAPKDQKTLKSFESCGYISLEKAAELLSFAWKAGEEA